MAKKKAEKKEKYTTDEGVLIQDSSGNLTREFRDKYPDKAQKLDDKK